MRHRLLKFKVVDGALIVNLESVTFTFYSNGLHLDSRNIDEIGDHKKEEWKIDDSNKLLWRNFNHHSWHDFFANPKMNEIMISEITKWQFEQQVLNDAL